ncbi:MAG TPA: DUF1326 domain-containing protein [Candidatus Polarisedimenticolia bacterium]|nr:DUF1326 domain-containing protein [Candidatus Polarisedimenticolia bacterium]
MKRMLVTSAAVLAAVAAGFAAADKPAAAPEWHMNATVIEACSCPMFCQCYFNSKPHGHAAAGHEGHGGAHHFCRFNNAYKVNKGHFGDVKLDGAKFWTSGDLGGDFSEGKMDWAVLTFDKATTPDQRKAIQTIVGHLFPVTWNSLTTAEGDIAWTATRTDAHATIDGGKTAEVKLAAPATAMVKGEPVVMKNLQYWGAPRNDGFVMMPNEVVAYRVGPKAYEYKGTNGFMLTLDIDSRTAPAPAGQ